VTNPAHTTAAILMWIAPCTNAAMAETQMEQTKQAEQARAPVAKMDQAATFGEHPRGQSKPPSFGRTLAMSTDLAVSSWRVSDEATVEYVGQSNAESFSAAAIRVDNGTEKHLESTCVVGSGEGAALKLEDRLVSRIHA